MALRESNDALELLSVEALDALIDVIKTKENYKTRIHATHALTKFTRRQDYGGDANFVKVWNCVVISLDQVAKVPLETEFKYAETLESNLVNLMFHLTEMLQEDDHLIMSEFIGEYSHVLHDVLINILSKSLKINDNEADDLTIFLLNPKLEEYLN